MELQQIANPKHRAIIKNIIEGIDTKTILTRHAISKPSYFRIKKRYEDALVEVQSADIVEKDIEDYTPRIIDKGKAIALKIANTLVKKNLAGASLGQLSQSLINVNTLIRLEEGKSTENIAHGVVHNLNPEQLTLIQESIMNLKKSMLSSSS